MTIRRAFVVALVLATALAGLAVPAMAKPATSAAPAEVASAVPAARNPILADVPSRRVEVPFPLDFGPAASPLAPAPLIAAPLRRAPAHPFREAGQPRPA